MTELSAFAISGGELIELPVPEKAEDVHDLFAISSTTPSIYSALRTYGGNRFLGLDAHFARCRRGLARAEWQEHFDFDELARALDQCVRAGEADTRLRFDLLQRPVEVGAVSASVLIGRGPHRAVAPEIFRTGAQLDLAPPGLTRERPEIKFADWVVARQVCGQQPSAALDHLLLDAEGRILEGTSCNFYAIRAGTLLTAGDGILEGITRQVVLELAERRGLTLNLHRQTLEELSTCEEALISSSTRELVPVTKVADTLIGTGRPGPVFAGLLADYRAYAESHAKRAHQ